MLSGTQSGCVNHPGVEAVLRCKQCSRPVCSACVTTGPTGRFCSPDCRHKHEVFSERAQALDGKARGSFFVKLRGALGALVIAVAVLAAVGLVATFVEIPVLTNLTYMVRGWIGF